MAPYLNHSNFLQYIFFVFLLLLITCSGSLLNHDDECLALYRFKQTVHHQDHASFGALWKITNNASDGSGTSQSDCCLWDGVECSNEKHVIGLDLSESFLRGTITSNTTLFSLVHLQTLNLASNDFAESQIPSEIGHLKQLKSLNLSGSGFSGQIPNEVGELVQLSSLDLSQNLLKLQSPSFEKLVQNLTRLEELHLSEVDISSSVPRFLVNFSSLRSIWLDDCRLQKEFPPAILHLPNLKSLNVSYNTDLTGSFPEFRNSSKIELLDTFSTGFFGIIPESISNLHLLTYLDLGECSFSGHIPSSLSNMTQLVALWIGYNDFTSNIVLPSLVTLSELEILELSGNQFKNRRLPNWLGKLNKLTQLYLNEMNLYGEIPSFLGNLTQLTDFEIAKNSIFGPIPSWFFNLTQMREIYLANNQLQGPISSSFSNFKNLESLLVETNNFSGRVNLDVFLGLSKLDSLHIGDNNISLAATNNYTNGTLPQLELIGLSSCDLKEFPAFLRFQHKIEVLILYNNKIDGMLPDWSWNNSQQTLRILDLSNNYMTGQFPRSLPWVRLEYFNIEFNKIVGQPPIPPQTIQSYVVSSNNFRGRISPMLCELELLRVLDLSSNNMSGRLPPCFGSLSNSLLVLDLHRNNFHGAIMNAFTHGNQLKNIDLSENQFTGHVSISLANCTNLEFLSLGDNSFDDVFPSWLGTLPRLQVLILRSNKFHGAIQGPKTISSHFPKLRIIDLSNNGFSGQLPEEYFQAWSAMKSGSAGKSSYMQSEIEIDQFHHTTPYSMTLTYKGQKTEYTNILNIFFAIDLSCNNFKGQMPQSLQYLQGLESLNLSNNQFIGGVLPSFGNLHNLESLDLSHNELSGEIPQQLVQLGFLAIFNVSFNHLDGRIPQGKQFNTFENNSYKGNPGLCGTPLSNECQNSKAPTPPPKSNESESLLPSEIIDWIIIFSGFGSGLVAGIVIGNHVYARYSDRFIKRLRMTKDKWARQLSNKRRNQQ